ncbi:hypothetical protein GO001_33575 [Streptomyces sp. NRRL B-1677]|uniref:hypothetical protein n=1 Tax=Streptomyces sp. NRRL B-1677 TaxID=2682966 RepID=UPI001892A05A|nr:hypothetical protein [Streptomyces sp. NRRL B-1677]MBF6050051.1 hypothetical protein [Streptomyces sp. NRRL B-1677]
MVVLGMPENLTTDLGTDLRQFGAVRHCRDLGQADSIWGTVDSQEDTKGLSADDFANHLRSYRERLARR